MIDVYIISGFLGSGKTTLIKRILDDEALLRPMLIENEFGEISVDDKLFDEGLKVKTIKSGCICCSLKGDFSLALDEIASYNIASLIIEPSGVGKLSEVMETIRKDCRFKLKGLVAMCDARMARMYHRNYHEFYDDQLIMADTVVLSHLDETTPEKLNETMEIVTELNDETKIVAEDYRQLSGEAIVKLISSSGLCACAECSGCIDTEKLLEGILGEMEDHHEHDHHHHEHHHHDADEVFTSIGFKTGKVFAQEELTGVLAQLKDQVVRAKGFVNGAKETLYFDIAGKSVFVNEGPAKSEGVVVIIAENPEESWEGLFL